MAQEGAITFQLEKHSARKEETLSARHMERTAKDMMRATYTNFTACNRFPKQCLFNPAS
jgi:hypothetical protein